MVTTGCGIKSETKDLNTILLLYYNERNENKEKIMRIGSSLGVVIDKLVIDNLNLKVGDIVK